MVKKKDVYKYTWVRMAEGRLVDRALMDNVLLPKRMLGRLLDVNVLRVEGVGMSYNFLVEARLKNWWVDGGVLGGWRV